MRMTSIALLLLAVAAPTEAEECQVLDNFKDAAVGSFPKGWVPRKAPGRQVYTVQVEDGRPFVRAWAKGLGIEADRRGEWNIEQLPVLAWRWRPRLFPTGADERERGKNDSVLGVYVGFKSAWSSLKYIWSERVEVGAEWDTGAFGLTKMRVVASGRTADSTTWRDVRVDVASDFQRRLGKRNLEPPAGIAILTDGDDTNSEAIGDYADFRICKR